MRFVSRSLIVALAATAALAAPAVAVRAAKPAERQGIDKTLSKAFGESIGCFARDLVEVSTVDSRYALWSGTDPYRQAHGCVIGDGFIIMRRQANGAWTRRLHGAWFTAPCAQIGSRVARDLTLLPCSR